MRKKQQNDKPDTASKEKPRSTYSSPRQEARQIRILEVARSEITRVGYEKITMQRLAEAAKVSTKTLYNLYGSKDELLISAVENLLEELLLEVKQLDAREGVESLITLLEVSSQHLAKTPHYSEVMARALFQAEKGHRLITTLLGHTREPALAAFAYSKEQGELDAETDIVELAELLTSHQWGLILTWSKGMISTRQLGKLALRSQLTTLYPISRGRLKKWIKKKAGDNNIPL